jgi:hypothetical protein
MFLPAKQLEKEGRMETPWARDIEDYVDWEEDESPETYTNNEEGEQPPSSPIFHFLPKTHKNFMAFGED